MSFIEKKKESRDFDNAPWDFEICLNKGLGLGLKLGLELGLRVR